MSNNRTKFEKEFYQSAQRHANEDYEVTGYGFRANQEVRFETFFKYVLDDVKFRHGAVGPYTLLDVGCGSGDLLHALVGSNRQPERYVGVDRHAEFLAHARQRFTAYGRDKKEIEFSAGEINAEEVQKDLEPYGRFDYVVCIATLAMCPPEWSMADRLMYIKDQIETMASHTKTTLMVTLFSTWKNKHLPEEMNVNPTTMFDWAMERFGRVDLIHGYAPHDFTLIIRFDEGRWWTAWREARNDIS